MVVHQHERMDLRPEASRQLGHSSEEPPSILVRVIDRFPAITPAHHMIPAVGYMDSQAPRHAASLIQFNRNIDCLCLTTLL